jgi:hypothetical protein
MAEQDRGWYVYCVVAAGERPRLEGQAGVHPESEVGLVSDRRLSAVASTVPLEEFGAEALRKNLEDMAWLERSARAHQAVLDRVLESTTALVPMRLCTIFDDEQGVREMLAREGDVLLGSLERVRDHSEWSVKVLADRAAVDAAVRARREADAPEPGGTGAGHAYLARKRAERSLRERSQELVVAAAEEVHGRLSEEAEAATLLPPQRKELSGRSGEMVLNGAYLVHRSRVGAFKATAEELGQARREIGLELDLSGPWAPYNFVAAEQPA